jgi:hypothetical protein
MSKAGFHTPQPVDPRKPPVPLEGVVYGEVAAWLTVVGMAVAVVGLLIGFVWGGGVLEERGLLGDLFRGRGEGSIWANDSVFAHMPEHYWFLKERFSCDELSMLGLVIACYGGVAGTWGMFLSMFRKTKAQVSGRGLYRLLAGVIGIVLTLAAIGILSLG